MLKKQLKSDKTLALPSRKMYRKVKLAPTEPETFELPFEGKLSSSNRWVMMSNLIPWSEFEEEYAKNFDANKGAPAKSFRLALGALIIKEILGTSDRETVLQIQENPYLQYFLGLPSYSNEAPFEASMLVHFRNRITIDLVNKINKQMVGYNSEEENDELEEENEKQQASEIPKQGKLILDATCSPADIKYPNDLGLLNQAREQTEQIIDLLYQQTKDKLNKKPRTYRKRARKDYLKVAKERRPSSNKRRQAIKKQLQYIKRNLAHIDQLIAEGATLNGLSKRRYKKLLVTAEIYRQQLWMWKNKKRSISNRIVSIEQPHVRPLVRGKAGKTVEFGAKLSSSCINGYIFLDYISWDNFNESGYLKDQVEKFKIATGFYPESVHVDKIYRTRPHRSWCKEKGIRMSGPPLGRPPKNISKALQKQAQSDEKIRNTIEGKFGQGKRRFGLDRVMAKLPNTSFSVIAITFLVMNLSRLLRQIS